MTSLLIFALARTLVWCPTSKERLRCGAESRKLEVAAAKIKLSFAAHAVRSDSYTSGSSDVRAAGMGLKERLAAVLSRQKLLCGNHYLTCLLPRSDTTVLSIPCKLCLKSS